MYIVGFALMDGLILDPFAGGSVRGIVANYLGYRYTGLELRQEQVDSNREQSLNILDLLNNQPQWYCGDSEKLLRR
jgi:DNA modification methylase